MATLNIKLSRLSAGDVEVQLNQLRSRGVTYARVNTSLLSTEFTVYGPPAELQRIHRAVVAHQESYRLYSHSFVISKSERAIYSEALERVWRERVKIPIGFFKDEVTLELIGTEAEFSVLEREISRLRLSV